MIIKLIWDGGAKRKRVKVNEEKGWTALISQIESFVGFRPEKLVDEDDCEIDGVDVLENGLKVFVLSTNRPNLSAPSAPLMEPLPASTSVKAVDKFALRSLAFEAVEAMQDHAASMRLLSLAKIVISNLCKIPNQDKSLLVKYRTVNVKKLLKAAKNDVVGSWAQRLLLAMGFVDVNGEGKKYTLDESMALSKSYLDDIKTVLDELFVEFRQDQGPKSSAAISLNLMEAEGGPDNKSGIPWSERHLVMETASAMGIKRPLLSSDRLQIYVNELRARREMLKARHFEEDLKDGGDGEQQRLNRLRIRVFDEDGRNLQALSEIIKGNVNGTKCDSNGVPTTQVLTSNGEADSLREGSDIISSESSVNTREQATLMKQRAVSATKELRKGFRTKDAVKLEKMQRKDKLNSKTLLKIGERGGTSISARFSPLETGKDVMRYIVRDIVSQRSKEAIKSGALELVLTCRDPDSSRGSSIFARTSEMNWRTADANSDLASCVDDDSGKSLLEWKLVPSGRVWLEVRSSGRKAFAAPQQGLKDLLRPTYQQLFSAVEDLRQ